MSALLVSLVASVVLGQEAAAPPRAALSPDEVTRAVEQLGDERIAVRDQATQTLWEAGTAVEPALRKALTSPDAEIRLRARSILERFRFGIFPDTPPEIVTYIQRFRNGDANIRAAVLQQLAEKQAFPTLFALIDSEDDPAQQLQLVSRFIQDPTGVVGQLVLDGKLAEAERLLELGISQDQGMLGLVTWAAARGTLDQRIERTRQELGNTRDPKRTRLLLYLLRAKGDYQAARDLAVALGDVSLERALLFEARDWKTLAARDDLHTPRLPAPLVINQPANNPDMERIERLGFAAAYHRLAGNAEQVEAMLAGVRQLFADKTDLRTYCLEALLINDRPAEAMKLQSQTSVSVAFDLLTYQHKYREAFEVVGWKAGQEADRKWFDALPVDARGNPAYQRIRLGCLVARTLHLLGRKEEGQRIFTLLATVAGEQPANTAPWQLFSQLATYEYRSGLTELAFEHAGKSMTDGGNVNYVMRGLFGTRTDEAEAWSNAMRHREGALAHKIILARIHRLFQAVPPADEPAGEFAERVNQNVAALAGLEAAQRMPMIFQIGATCANRNETELARKCWEPIAAEFPQAALRLGDLAAQAQAWADAARWYRQAWNKDRQQVLALYLSGIALEKAGQVDAGRDIRQKASLVALGPRVRHTLAQGLQQRDYNEEATAQWNLLLQTAPFEQWEINDGARLLGELIADHEPERAADLSERSMLNNLRTSSYYLETESLLRMPFLIHKLRAQAAAGRGDFVRVQQESNLAAAASPHDVRLAEDVVPLLDKAGRKEEADRLFHQQFDLLDAVVREYPDSAFHRNNLAWLAARTHRKLDEALTHAEAAVKLLPDTGSYLDTLAEVHFHRGNREEAIRLEERALKLAPGNKTYREQMARFQKDPLPGSGAPSN